MFAISSLFLPSVLLHSQQPQLVLEFWDSAQPLGVSSFFFLFFLNLEGCAEMRGICWFYLQLSSFDL